VGFKWGEKNLFWKRGRKNLFDLEREEGKSFLVEEGEKRFLKLFIVSEFLIDI